MAQFLTVLPEFNEYCIAPKREMREGRRKRGGGRGESAKGIVKCRLDMENF